MAIVVVHGCHTIPVLPTIGITLTLYHQLILCTILNSSCALSWVTFQNVLVMETVTVVVPYDMCIQHREWRSFTPSGGLPQSKFSPAYYHVNVLCVQRNWPHFIPAIEPEIRQKLGAQHVEFLHQFGCMHV